MLKNRIKKFIKKILKKCGMVSKKDLDKVVNKINELESKNYIVEKDLFATYKALEYKVWEFNTNLNKILFDSYVNDKKRKKNFSPLVSIIIPVYNGSNYLEQAIDSALKQTYKNTEIIVVNDGSNDNGLTKGVATKFKSKIRYYEKKNGGVSSALNYGISKMRGEYFSWLSHDDLMEPSHIQNLINFISIEGNDKVIPFSSFKIVDENGTLKVNETIIAQLHCSDYKISIKKNEYSLLQGDINGGSVLIPKTAFEKYGLFAEEQRITQERDMWSRLIQEYHFINIPYDTAIIRSHSKQVTNTNSKIKIKSDKKNLEIIKNLSSDVMERLEYNKASFYSVMRAYYLNHNNIEMVRQMEQLLNQEYKNEEKL